VSFVTFVFFVVFVFLIPAHPRAQQNRDAAMLIGRAMSAVQDGRYADAKEALDRALALEPSLPRARAMLGVVLYRLGDLPGAIAVYDSLSREFPDEQQTAVTLARWQREAALHDRMQQTVGAHFTVSFEGPAEEALAARAIASLDKAYWRIGDALAVYPTELLPVVLYTEEQFHDITRSPAWAAGAYDGTIRVPVRGALDEAAELDRVVAHEFTHALIHTIAPRRVPTWLDEGLAAALESTDMSWCDRTLRASRARAPLANLDASFGRFSGAEAQLAYAQSAVAARRLLDEDGGFAVANLLRDLAADVPLPDAFAHRMQQTLPSFERSLWQTDSNP